jgi:hypothetical protein
VFLISTLDEGAWSASRLCSFTLGERASVTHYKGGCVDARTDLDAVEKKIIVFPCWRMNPDSSAVLPIA